MADFDFGISARDLYSSVLNQLKGELTTLRSNFADTSLMGQRTGNDVSAALGQLLQRMGEVNREARVTATSLASLSTGAAAINSTTDALERNIGAMQRATQAALSFLDIETARSRQAQNNMRGEVAARELIGADTATRSGQQAATDFNAAFESGIIRSRTTGRFVGFTEDVNQQRFNNLQNASIEKQKQLRQEADSQRTAFYTREMNEIASLQAARTKYNNTISSANITEVQRVSGAAAMAQARANAGTTANLGSFINQQTDIKPAFNAVQLDEMTRAGFRLRGSLGAVQEGLKLNRIGFLELEAAGVNSIQALASGMNPLHVAVMESAQVMGALVQGGLIPSRSIIGFLTSAAGAYAIAGVAAFTAVAYAAQQATSRFMSLRDTQASLATIGFGTAPIIPVGGTTQRFDAAKEFDEGKKATNEFAGTQAALISELNKLPPAAQGIRRELEGIAKGYAGINREDPTKILEELVKAAQAGPGPLAELITKLYGLQDVTNSSSQSLIEQAKYTTNLADAYGLVGRTGFAQQINTIGQETRKAGNDMLAASIGVVGLASSIGTGPAGLIKSMLDLQPHASAFVSTFQKWLNPLKGVAQETHNVSGAIAAQNAAIVSGNEGLNKRIGLLERLKSVTEGAERVGTDFTSSPEGISRANNARANIEAEVGGSPLQAGEQKAHELILLHIREQANARHADLQAQLQAQRAVVAETLRVETLKTTGPGISSGRSEELAKGTVSYQTQLNKELAIHDQIRDEKVASTIAGINAQIAAESQGSAAKIALTQQAIDLTQQEVNAGHKKQAELDALVVQRVAFERQANQEAFNIFSRNAENRLSVAKGDWGAITGIIEEWKQKAKEAFGEHAGDFAKAMEGIESRGISAYKSLVSSALSEAGTLRSANQDILSSFQRQQDVKVRDMGASGTFAAPSAIQESISKARELETINRQVLENVMKQADAIGDAAQQTQVYRDLWRLGTQTQNQVDSLLDKQSQSHKNITQAVQDTQLAQLKQNEVLAQARGDFAAIVELRREEAAIINANKDSTAAQKTSAETAIIQSQIQAQQQSIRLTQQGMESANRFASDRLQTNLALLDLQVAQGNLGKEAAIRSEMSLTQAVMAQQQARLKSFIDTTNLEPEHRAAANEKLASLYEQDVQKQIELQTRLTETIQRENEQRLQHVKGFFESTGSAMGDLLIAGLTKSQTKEQALKQFANSIMSSFAKEAMGMASQFAGKGLASVLGVNLKEGEDSGIGSVLAKAVGSMLGLTKPEPKDGMAQVAPKLELAASAHKEAAALLSKSAAELSAVAEKAPYSGGDIAAKAIPSRAEVISGTASKSSTTEYEIIKPISSNPETDRRFDTAGLKIDTDSLRQLKEIIGEGAKSLPEGYSVRAISTQRPGAIVAGTDTKSEHGFGRAIDTVIIDPRGKQVPGSMGVGGPLYQQLDRAVEEAAAKIAPEKDIAIGSRFSRRPDAGHYSLGGPEAASQVARENRLGSSMDQLGAKISTQTAATQQDTSSTTQLKSDILANSQATNTANQSTITDSQKSLENSVTNKDNTQATKDLTQELKNKSGSGDKSGEGTTAGAASGGGSSNSSSPYNIGNIDKNGLALDPSQYTANQSYETRLASYNKWGGNHPDPNFPSLDPVSLRSGLLGTAIKFQNSSETSKFPDWTKSVSTNSIDMMKRIPDRNISQNEYELIKLQSAQDVYSSGAKTGGEMLFPKTFDQPHIKEGMQLDLDSRIKGLQQSIEKGTQATNKSSNAMQQSSTDLSQRASFAQQEIQATQQEIQATQKGSQDYDQNSQATSQNSQAVQANTQALSQKQGGGGGSDGMGGKGAFGGQGGDSGADYSGGGDFDYGGGGDLDYGIDYGGGGYVPGFAEGTSDSFSSGASVGGSVNSLTSAFSAVNSASSGLSSALSIASNASSLFGSSTNSATGNIVGGISKFMSIISSVMGMFGGGGGMGGMGGMFGGILSIVPKIFGMFASGTSSTPRGTILVGERGPELIHQPGGLGVLPAGPTRALMRQMHSAAGGMVVGNSPTFAMLHPREMVLPMGISDGLQSIIAQGGANNNSSSGTSHFNYNANVTGYHPYASRSSFEGMLREHGTTMQNWAEGIIRNQSLSRARR